MAASARQKKADARRDYTLEWRKSLFYTSRHGDGMFHGQACW
jgi:hypothetical protein